MKKFILFLLICFISEALIAESPSRIWNDANGFPVLGYSAQENKYYENIGTKDVPVWKEKGDEQNPSQEKVSSSSSPSSDKSYFVTNGASLFENVKSFFVYLAQTIWHLIKALWFVGKLPFMVVAGILLLIIYFLFKRKISFIKR